MAPGQIRGKAAATDVPVDLYAAGVSLFLMLTGKRPIDADDTVQLLAAVLENPPLTLSQATGIPWPKPLEDFIAKAMQYRPEVAQLKFGAEAAKQFARSEALSSNPTAFLAGQLDLNYAPGWPTQRPSPARACRAPARRA
jgi:serine/threonine protein kinase